MRFALLLLALALVAPARAQLAFPIGGTGFDAAHAVAYSPGGAFFVGGDFEDTVDLDTGAGFQDIYVARYAADGPAAGPAFEWGITTDDALNCYVTGFFRGTADFDSGGAATVLTSAGNSTDAFVASFGSLGGFRWAFPLGGVSADAGNAVAFADGSLYVGGSFAGTADFDPRAGTSAQTAALDDAFVARYTPDSPVAPPALAWVNHVGADGADNAVNALARTAAGILAVGQFQETADVDPGPGTTALPSAGLDDALVLQYAVDGSFATAGEDAPAAGTLALSAALPNPSSGPATLTLTVQEALEVRVEAFDALGRRVAVVHDGALAAGVHMLTLDTSALPAVVRAAGPGFAASRRLVVAR